MWFWSNDLASCRRLVRLFDFAHLWNGDFADCFGEPRTIRESVRVFMKYRVLCIEDDEVDRHLLQRRIDRIDTDIEPVFVDTLEAAFSETEALCPDLVLLDWHLLDGDGDDYLEFVSGKYPWLPVIILTSEPDELASSTLQTGAQDFLTKGKFDDAQFERAITYSLLRARSRGLKHLEHEAKKREPIQRYASKFVSDVRQPTRALATKLDRLDSYRPHAPPARGLRNSRSPR